MTTRSLATDQRAAVYVEFLVVFMPVFFLFLGMIQIGLMFSAKMVVQHAADAACRSAIVIIPDDPIFYSGEETPKNELSFGTTGEAGDTLNQILDLVETLTGTSGIPRIGASTGDKRLNSIRIAAFRPLMGIAPSLGQQWDAEGSDSIRQAIGDNSLERFFYSMLYNVYAVGITFPSAPSADDAQNSGTQNFSDGNLTTRVTYMYHCAMPFAAQLMCDRILEIGRHSPQGARELDSAVAAAGRIPVALARGYYRVMRAEATMLLQTAPYNYRIENMKNTDGATESAPGSMTKAP